MLGNQKVAPFVFQKEIDKGKILYANFAPLLKSKPAQYSDPETLLKSLDQSLLNYVKRSTRIKLVPIEIYGEQNLNGDINISSTYMAFHGSNITSLFKPANEEGCCINTSYIIFYSPHNLMLSLNTSAILRPLHDEYVEILIPKGAIFRLSSHHEGKEILAYLPDKGRLYNVSEAILYSASNISLTVRSPNITVSGIVKLQGAFFDIPYNKVIKNGLEALTLRGMISYNILISDKNANRCYGDYFHLIGSYKYNYPTLLEIELPMDILRKDP
jgi:hypothetical protein